jgi:FkbM family methyltransferase
VLARGYARLWQLFLSTLPEGALKIHVRNNLLGAAWPDDSFAVQTVELCDGVAARLKPRPGSLALSKAMFRDRLAHEPEVFAFLKDRLGAYDAVLEIGANIGAYTILFSKLVPSRDGKPTVFSFEPSKRAYGELLRHIALNDLSNVRAFNSAVGPAGLMASFHENARDWMKGSVDPEVAAFFRNDAPSETVAVAHGPELTALLQPYDRILVKIDVVGAEADVIRTLNAFIEAKRPDILLGVSSLNLEKLNAVGTLRKHYELFRIEVDNLARREQFVDEQYCNYFLRAA